MHSEIKVGIVEDELIIAEKIKRTLLSVGYEVCEPACSVEEALRMIETDKPDMLLIDINLKDKRDGIDLASIINERYQLPFIFLTANIDSVTIERAKKVKPNAYIVKPFTKDELFAAIEIAFNNYSLTKTDTTAIALTKNNFIFVREGSRFVKLLFDEVVYIESCENYVVIHTTNNKNTIIRSTFSLFLAQLPSGKFSKTHRCFAVQTDLVDNISPTAVLAKGYKIPVSSTYRSGLYSILGIKE